MKRKTLIYILFVCCFCFYVARLYYLGSIVTILSIQNQPKSNRNDKLTILDASSSNENGITKEYVIISLDRSNQLRGIDNGNQDISDIKASLSSNSGSSAFLTNNKEKQNYFIKMELKNKIINDDDEDLNELNALSHDTKPNANKQGNADDSGAVNAAAAAADDDKIEEDKNESIRNRNDRARKTIKALKKIRSRGIEYSPGLETQEIGPICSSDLGMKKYRCDYPNEYCNMTQCKHTSVFQLKPGISDVDITDFSRSFEHMSRYFSGMEERLILLDKKLNKYHELKQIKKNSRPLFIMFVNFGYVYQFLNWLCGCEKNNINGCLEDVMVLTTDAYAEDMLKSIGVYTIQVSEFGSWMRHTHYDVGPSRKFGLGVHAKINTQSIGLLCDIIQLGYDVFVMDADLVWRKDPRPEMIRIAKEKNYDGLFISDARSWDYVVSKGHILEQFRERSDFDHPYTTHNTGFFLIRSSSVMKEFMSSLMRGLHLILWKGTDQMWWNTLIFHKKFSHLKFGILPEDQYIPGSRISTSGSLKNPTMPFPKDDYIVAHMSDTNSHLKKITKFYLTGQWFLTESCSLFDPCIHVKNDDPLNTGCLPRNYKDFYFRNATV